MTSPETRLQEDLADASEFAQALSEFVKVEGANRGITPFAATMGCISLTTRAIFVMLSRAESTEEYEQGRTFFVETLTRTLASYEDRYLPKDNEDGV